jgi:hypothetical protein
MIGDLLDDNPIKIVRNEALVRNEIEIVQK